ncbi:flavoprotein super protein [Maudiozyma exigua]|uniref:Flavoprotein super protein n=1 Tax=Maudiozyma exigua TaxID=34358 RepID=A0A9P7BCN8_MAUEX|nr:flavoprotein super protein [Kazachstania exigua]
MEEKDLQQQKQQQGTGKTTAPVQASILNNRQTTMSDNRITSPRCTVTKDTKIAIVEPTKPEPAINSPISLPPEETSNGKCISFETPKPENAPHHRLSISIIPKAKPKPIVEVTASNSEQDEGVDVEEKNCTVHMPGDFVYMSTDSPLVNEKEVSPTTSDVTNKESSVTNIGPETKKIIFKKQSNTSEPEVPFTAFFEKEDDKKFHILIGATGSVATIKIPLIIDKLFKIYTPEKVSIQLIVTKPAEHFLNGLKISSKVKIWREEYAIADTNNDMMLFHELRRWADILLIAPLSANSLAKLANGICNNLLTSVFRDWTISGAPVLVAPAMNTFMYMNPMTKRHYSAIEENFPVVEILKPVEKVLICGDIGMGGMREWSDIVEIVRLRIKEIITKRKLDAENGEEVDTIDADSEDEENNSNDDDDEEDDNNEDKNDETDSDDDDEEDEDDDDEDETSILNANIQSDRMTEETLYSKSSYDKP